ncbi:MAG: hypothetical protein V1750_01785 [Acidobacteriota bacterium]
MTRLKPILGTLWALAALPLLLALFLGFPRWQNALAVGTGLKVSPWYTGGAIMTSLPHDGYTTHVHRPIFDALVGEYSKGFVQVDFVPAEGKALPATIEETVEPAGDASMAFHVTLSTATRVASMRPVGPRPISIEGVYALGSGMAVRVNLANPR